jgi:two-component system, OmpR family, phosphate regulon sensor histidine kinase PhoR
MKRRLLAIVLLAALAGLIFIQFRLLLVGVRLEKQRFDQQTEAAIHAAALALDEAGPTGDALVRYLSGESPADTAPALSQALDSVLVAELRRQGVTAHFHFAITDYYAKEVFLASPGFSPESFSFGRYTVRLGGRITGECACNRALHLDVSNLFTYLVGELDYLIIPSVLCLVAIVFCLALLTTTLRKEQRLNQVKNDFINNLTHELKTPAFSIALSARMASESLEKGDADKARQFLRLIGKENEKLKMHIEKVLELASLQDARYTLQREPASLHEIIPEVLEEFAPQVQERGGTLTHSLKAQNSRAEVDMAHFKNVLRNLLDNALKYSPGPPHISVATANDGHIFELTVKDKGMGIPAAEQKLVFDKFYRVSTGDRHSVKGFGLGLNYVKQILTAHGGAVELTSEVGVGTTIKTRWPQ